MRLHPVLPINDEGKASRRRVAGWLGILGRRERLKIACSVRRLAVRWPIQQTTVSCVAWKSLAFPLVGPSRGLRITAANAHNKTATDRGQRSSKDHGGGYAKAIHDSDS